MPGRSTASRSGRRPRSSGEAAVVEDHGRPGRQAEPLPQQVRRRVRSHPAGRRVVDDDRSVEAETSPERLLERRVDRHERDGVSGEAALERPDPPTRDAALPGMAAGVRVELVAVVHDAGAGPAGGLHRGGQAGHVVAVMDVRVGGHAGRGSGPRQHGAAPAHHVVQLAAGLWHGQPIAEQAPRDEAVRNPRQRSDREDDADRRTAPARRPGVHVAEPAAREGAARSPRIADPGQLVAPAPQPAVVAGDAHQAGARRAAFVGGQGAGGGQPRDQDDVVTRLRQRVRLSKHARVVRGVVRHVHRDA